MDREKIISFFLSSFFVIIITSIFLIIFVSDYLCPPSHWLTLYSPLYLYFPSQSVVVSVCAPIFHCTQTLLLFIYSLITALFSYRKWSYQTDGCNLPQFNPRSVCRVSLSMCFCSYVHTTHIRHCVHQALVPIANHYEVPMCVIMCTILVSIRNTAYDFRVPFNSILV